MGLLGFGGDKGNARTAQFEGSAAMLLSPRLAVGAEIRTKPDRLGFAREQDAYDAFAAWAPHRNFTLTAAYADLGDIALELVSETVLDGRVVLLEYRPGGAPPYVS